MRSAVGRGLHSIDKAAVSVGAGNETERLSTEPGCFVLDRGGGSNISVQFFWGQASLYLYLLKQRLLGSAIDFLRIIN
jgi:hypothetical protein